MMAPSFARRAQIVRCGSGLGAPVTHHDAGDTRFRHRFAMARAIQPSTGTSPVKPVTSGRFPCETGHGTGPPL
jgi:hypothetical protein